MQRVVSRGQFKLTAVLSRQTIFFLVASTLSDKEDEKEEEEPELIESS